LRTAVSVYCVSWVRAEGGVEMVVEPGVVAGFSGGRVCAGGKVRDAGVGSLEEGVRGLAGLETETAGFPLQAAVKMKSAARRRRLRWRIALDI